MCFLRKLLCGCRKNPSLVLLLCVIAALAASCTSAPTVQAPQAEPPVNTTVPPATRPQDRNAPIPIPTLTPSPQFLATATSTPQPATPTALVMAAAASNVEVHQIDPLSNGTRRTFGPGFWNSEYKFTFEYDTEGASTQWAAYNVTTQLETLALAPAVYDDTFWQRRGLWQVSDDQEVVGYYSPSGNYVLYSLWHSSDVNPPARSEIWIADTLEDQAYKIQTFGSLNVSIAQAAWFKDESRVLFSVVYEGPNEIFITDLPGGETKPLSEMTDFNGVSEESWSLSPDDQMLAVVDHNLHLLLVPLDGGKTQVVESSGGLLPSWSTNGEWLYYWWGSTQSDRRHLSELRKFDPDTGEITMLVNEASILRGLQTMQAGSQSNTTFNTGSPYAVSPDEKKVLIWAGGLYWVVWE